MCWHCPLKSASQRLTPLLKCPLRSRVELCLGPTCALSLISSMSDHAIEDLRGDQDTDWTSAASAVDSVQQDKIEMFCSVTGADADSAMRVLDAHNWDMDRSVVYFMEGGAPAVAQQQSRPPHTAAAPGRSHQLAEDPINLDDDLHPLEPQRPAEATGAAPPSQHEVRHTSHLLYLLWQPHIPYAKHAVLAAALGNG